MRVRKARGRRGKAEKEREIKVRGENNKSRTGGDSRLKGACFTLPLKKCVPSCSRKQEMRLEWLM